MYAQIPEPSLEARKYSVELKELKNSVGSGFVQLALFNNYWHIVVLQLPGPDLNSPLTSIPLKWEFVLIFSAL